MTYELTIRRQPIKILLKMPHRNSKLIRHALDKLADNPVNEEMSI